MMALKRSSVIAVAMLAMSAWPAAVAAADGAGVVYPDAFVDSVCFVPTISDPFANLPVVDFVVLDSWEMNAGSTSATQMPCAPVVCPPGYELVSSVCAADHENPLAAVPQSRTATWPTPAIEALRSSGSATRQVR